MTEPDSARDPVEALVAEFFDRRRRGESSDVATFARRVPGREAEFRELIETLSTLESAAEQHSAAPAPAGAPALVARERLGRHRLLRIVGRGGMGVVYEAVDDELGRHVALKVLPGHATLDEREIARFHREAQSAARLRHPHIVPLFGVGEEQGTHWLAMQFVQGQSLDSLLRSQRDGDADRLAPAEVARHGLAIADALASAHAEGVLHRDVKPSNLLLDVSGVVWITDFGLAKSEGSASLTRTGEMVGTPRYMAPEAFSGWADPRTDVWGLGATLYELLAGRPAFDGADRAQLLKQICDIEPAPLRRVDPAIPRDLATIVHKCLQKEAAARYATARELADDLARFLAGEPIRARPTSLAYRAGLTARRHPRTTTAALAALLAVLGLLAAWSASLRHKNQRLEEEQQRAAANLRIASDSIERLLREFGDDVFGREPVLDPVRRQLFETALGFELRLLEQQKDDPSKLFDVAFSHVLVGDVDRQLGRHDDAAVHYRAAIGLLRPWVEAQPDDVEAAFVLASASRGEALGLWHRGENAAAIALFRANVDRLAPLVVRQPGSLKPAVALVDSAAHLCLLQARSRAAPEGVRLLRDALARTAPVFGPERTHDLVPVFAAAVLRQARSWLAEAERRGGELAAALADAEEAVRVGDRVDSVEALRPSERVATACARIRLASILLQLGRYDEAAPVIDAACSALDDCVQRAPPCTYFRSDLATALRFRATIALARDPTADVEPQLRRAVELADLEGMERPDDLKSLGERLHSRAALGTWLHEHGDGAAALALFESGTALAEPAVSVDRESSRDLALPAGTLWFDRGVVEQDLGDGARAERSHRQALALLEWADGGDRADLDAASLKVKVVVQLAALLGTRDGEDAARARWRDAQARARALLPADAPSLAEALRDRNRAVIAGALVRALNLDGNARARSGDPAGAAERLDEAVALAGSVAKEFPDDLTFAVALGSAHADRGWLRSERGDDALAQEDYLRALPLLTTAVRRTPARAPARQSLALVLDWLAATLAEPEGLEEVVAAARSAAAAAPDDPGVQLEAARVVARAARCRHDEAATLLGAASRDPWAEEAMELLRAAVAAGPVDRDRLEHDVGFAALHGREDFRTMVRELEDRKER